MPLYYLLIFVYLFIRRLNGYLLVSSGKNTFQKTGYLSHKNEADEGLDYSHDNKWSLGVDYGTSGVRTCLISCHYVNSKAKKIPINNYVTEMENELLWSRDLKFDSPDDWIQAFHLLINMIPSEYRKKISRICVSGTSSTCSVYDYSLGTINRIRGTRMYNFNILDSIHNKGIIYYEVYNDILLSLFVK